MQSEIEKFTRENQDWSVNDGVLTASFTLNNFDDVKAIIPKIMDASEVADHHPDVTFAYKKIEVRTVTHDAGNKITDKDLDLAKEISSLVTEHVS